jgi:nicotinamidase-related amidase
MPGPTSLAMLDLSSQTLDRGGSFGWSIGADVDLEGLPGRVNAALSAVRQAALPVVWVYPSAEMIARFGRRKATAADHRPDPRIDGPGEGEHEVLKEGIGAFDGDALDRVLGLLGVGSVALAGIATSYVVAETVAQAVERGLDVVVLDDLCADVSTDAHHAALERIRALGARVTPSPTWLADLAAGSA